MIYLMIKIIKSFCGFWTLLILGNFEVKSQSVCVECSPFSWRIWVSRFWTTKCVDTASDSETLANSTVAVPILNGSHMQSLALYLTPFNKWWNLLATNKTPLW